MMQINSLFIPELNSSTSNKDKTPDGLKNFSYLFSNIFQIEKNDFETIETENIITEGFQEVQNTDSLLLDVSLLLGQKNSKTDKSILALLNPFIGESVLGSNKILNPNQPAPVIEALPMSESNFISGLKVILQGLNNNSKSKSKITFNTQNSSVTIKPGENLLSDVENLIHNELLKKNNFSILIKKNGVDIFIDVENHSTETPLETQTPASVSVESDLKINSTSEVISVNEIAVIKDQQFLSAENKQIVNDNILNKVVETDSSNVSAYGNTFSKISSFSNMTGNVQESPIKDQLKTTITSTLSTHELSSELPLQITSAKTVESASSIIPQLSSAEIENTKSQIKQKVLAPNLFTEKEINNVDQVFLKAPENKSTGQTHQPIVSKSETKKINTKESLKNYGKQAAALSTNVNDSQTHQVLESQTPKIINDQAKGYSNPVKSINGIKDLMKEVKVESIFIRNTSQHLEAKIDSSLIKDKNTTEIGDEKLKSKNDSAVISIKQKLPETIQEKAPLQQIKILNSDTKSAAININNEEPTITTTSNKESSAEKRLNTTLPLSNKTYIGKDQVIESKNNTAEILPNKSGTSSANAKTIESFEVKSEKTNIESDLHIKSKAVKLNTVRIQNDLGKTFDVKIDTDKHVKDQNKNITTQQINKPDNPILEKEINVIDKTIVETLNHSKVNLPEASAGINQFNSENKIKVKRELFRDVLKNEWTLNNSEIKADNISDTKSNVSVDIKALNHRELPTNVLQTKTKDSAVNGTLLNNINPPTNINKQSSESPNNINSKTDTQNQATKNITPNTLQLEQSIGADTQPNKVFAAEEKTELILNYKTPITTEKIEAGNIGPSYHTEISLSTKEDNKTISTNNNSFTKVIKTDLNLPDKLSTVPENIEADQISLPDQTEISLSTNEDNRTISTNKNSFTKAIETELNLPDKLSTVLKNIEADEIGSSNLEQPNIKINSDKKSDDTEKKLFVQAKSVKKTTDNTKVKNDSNVKNGLLNKVVNPGKITSDNFMKSTVLEKPSDAKIISEPIQKTFIKAAAKTHIDQTTIQPKSVTTKPALNESVLENKSLSDIKTATTVEQHNHYYKLKTTELKLQPETETAALKIVPKINAETDLKTNHSQQTLLQQTNRENGSKSNFIEPTGKEISSLKLSEQIEPQVESEVSSKFEYESGAKNSASKISTMNVDPDNDLSIAKNKSARIETAAAKLINNIEGSLDQLQKQNLEILNQEEIIPTETTEKNVSDLKQDSKNKPLGFQIDKQSPAKSIGDVLDAEVQQSKSDSFQNKLFETGSISDNEIIIRNKEKLALPIEQNNQKLSNNFVIDDTYLLQESDTIDHFTNISDEEIHNKPNDIHIKIKIEPPTGQTNDDSAAKYNPFLRPLNEIKKVDETIFMRDSKQVPKPTEELKTTETLKDPLNSELNKAENKPDENNFNNHDKPKENTASFRTAHNQTNENFELKPTQSNTEIIQHRPIRQGELLKEIYQMIDAGEKKTALMKLMPEELGSVKIMIDTIDAKVTARIEVENESIQRFVQSNVESLKQSLQHTGVQLNSLTVSLAGSEQKHQNLNGNKKRTQFSGNSRKLDTSDEKVKIKKLGYNTYEYLA